MIEGIAFVTTIGSSQSCCLYNSENVSCLFSNGFFHDPPKIYGNKFWVGREEADEARWTGVTGGRRSFGGRRWTVYRSSR